MAQILRTPSQASGIYNFDGNTIPRSKNLFLVRFVRTDPQGSSTWKQALGFVVRSIDRPAVTPIVEEVNQYGKKRLITTGYKTGELRISFNDTADSLCQRMWVEYSRWYYGTFGQDAKMFSYDVTSAKMLDNGNNFGYKLQPNTNIAIDQNSQFFFDSVKVYQVFGGYYTQTDYINPKITSFDVSELSYDNSETATVDMSMSFESILYANNGSPKLIQGSGIDDPSIEFNGPFDGLALEVTGPARTIGFTTDNFDQSVSANEAALTGKYQIDAVNLRSKSSNVGSLGKYGNYNFGGALVATIGRIISGDTKNIVQDMTYLATGNNTLKTLVGLPSSKTKGLDAASIILSTAKRPENAADAAVYDTAKDMVNNLYRTGKGHSDGYTKQYIGQAIVGGLLRTANEGKKTSNDQVTKTSDGAKLSNETYNNINANRDGTSQLGYNDASGKNTSNNSEVNNWLSKNS